MSPEVCENKPYNYKSDLWALGCILYEMCTLKHAFDASNLLGLVFKIVQDKAPPVPDRYSPELRALVQNLLSKNPDERYDTRTLLSLPFIQKHLAGTAASCPPLPLLFLSSSSPCLCCSAHLALPPCVAAFNKSGGTVGRDLGLPKLRQLVRQKSLRRAEGRLTAKEEYRRRYHHPTPLCPWAQCTAVAPLSIPS